MLLRYQCESLWVKLLLLFILELIPLNLWYQIDVIETNDLSYKFGTLLSKSNIFYPEFRRAPYDWQASSTDSNWYMKRRKFMEKIVSHFVSAHHGANVFEGLLFRLWPLQEIVMSDSVQFVRCDSRPTPSLLSVNSTSKSASFLRFGDRSQD